MPSAIPTATPSSRARALIGCAIEGNDSSTINVGNSTTVVQALLGFIFWRPTMRRNREYSRQATSSATPAYTMV